MIFDKNHYPPIRVKEENPYYAKLLLEDYAGSVSELTASTQYFNHQSIVFKNYPQVSEVLSYIGNIETIHLQILGRLIKLLGLNPKYRIIREDNMRVWWSPIYIDYQRGVYNIIEANIKAEHEAINQYEKHVSLIKDDDIVAILLTIINDEREHIKILKQVYNDLKEDKPIQVPNQNI